jgi:hypothetical protein
MITTIDFAAQGGALQCSGTEGEWPSKYCQKHIAKNILLIFINNVSFFVKTIADCVYFSCVYVRLNNGIRPQWTSVINFSSARGHIKITIL